MTGTVTAQFIVDTTGRANVATIAITHSDDPRLARAVLEGVGQLNFVPATIEGVKTRQRLELPFDFRPPREAGCP